MVNSALVQNVLRQLDLKWHSQQRMTIDLSSQLQLAYVDGYFLEVSKQVRLSLPWRSFSTPTNLSKKGSRAHQATLKTEPTIGGAARLKLRVYTG